MRKPFELSRETEQVLAVFRFVAMGQSMTFEELSIKVGFRVTASSGAYHSARRIAERDDGIYIGTLRGLGFFRGTGEDMADSLHPFRKRIRNAAGRMVKRADLAISNNLPEDKHQLAFELRNRASIIHSTSGAPLAASNRKRAPPAPAAPPHPGAKALRGV